MRIALLLVVAAACHRQVQSPAAPVPREPMPRDAAGQIRQAIDAWRAAYEGRNADALEALYTHDADTIVVTDGVPFIGWPSVDPALRDRMANTPEIHIRLKEVQIAALAPTAAVAIATMTRDTGDGTTSVHEYGALTLVFHKSDAGWQIAAEHYSYKRAR
jgi:uncharacterized protein (TIGR02246 family)